MSSTCANCAATMNQADCTFIIYITAGPPSMYVDTCCSDCTDDLQMMLDAYHHQYTKLIWNNQTNDDPFEE